MRWKNHIDHWLAGQNREERIKVCDTHEACGTNTGRYGWPPWQRWDFYQTFTQIKKKKYTHTYTQQKRRSHIRKHIEGKTIRGWQWHRRVGNTEKAEFKMVAVCTAKKRGNKMGGGAENGNRLEILCSLYLLRERRQRWLTMTMI